jgi:hypothetical protein
MTEFILGSIVLIGAACMLVSFLAYKAGKAYDQWANEVNQGGSVRLEPVMMGGEVVGYTVVTTSPPRPL